MKKYGHWLFIAAVVILPLSVFAIVRWYETKFTKLPVLGGEQHRVANFNLRSHHDRSATLADWSNKIIVADFFFTRCPVVCPKMTRSLKKVQGVYTNDKDLLISSFTVDPERDSVAKLQQYATRMDISGNWLLLTGDKKEIYRLARKSFLVTATDGDGGENDFIHSELMILIDKQQRIRGFYNGTLPAEVDELIRDIDRLKKER